MLNLSQKGNDYPFALRRTQSKPLDVSSVFNTYDEAVEYARNDGTINNCPYEGQIIVAEGTAYILAPFETEQEFTNTNTKFKHFDLKPLSITAGKNVNISDKGTISINLSEGIEDKVKTSTDHITDYTNPHKVTKEQVGLENVNNTADRDKPVSTATQKVINDVVVEHFKDNVKVGDIFLCPYRPWSLNGACTIQSKDSISKVDVTGAPLYFGVVINKDNKYIYVLMSRGAGKQPWSYLKGENNTTQDFLYSTPNLSDFAVSIKYTSDDGYMSLGYSEYFSDKPQFKNTGEAFMPMDNKSTIQTTDSQAGFLEKKSRYLPSPFMVGANSLMAIKSLWGSNRGKGVAFKGNSYYALPWEDLLVLNENKTGEELTAYAANLYDYACIAARYTTINNSLKLIQSLFGSKAADLLDTDTFYWSSEEVNKDIGRYVSLYTGQVYGQYKTNKYYIRYVAKIPYGYMKIGSLSELNDERKVTYYNDFSIDTQLATLKEVRKEYWQFAKGADFSLADKATIKTDFEL